MPASDDFYRGDVGREIAADLERIGSPVTRADLESYEAKVAEPLSVGLEAGTLYNTPPPTQGLASLIILALFERLRVADAESFDHVHGIIEATKRAFLVRDRVIADPERIAQPLAGYLDKAFLDAEALKIDRRKAAKWPAPSGAGDTIWMGAANSSGLVVSFIQSLYWEFGSGVRAAGDRRADAEPRRELLARTRARRTCSSPAGSHSTHSIPRSRCCATGV